MPESPLPTDGQLVVATLAGQREQFALLVERYHAPLFRLAVNRLGRRDWAEDAVQETFLNAFRWLKSYDSRYSFRTWLWTILLNQCRAIGKRQAKAQDGSEPESLRRELLSPEPTPAEHAASREHTAQLNALLARLPETQADALRLRFFGDLSYPEIATAMQCSVSGAKLRVRSGLAQLSAWLEPNAPSSPFISLADRSQNEEA